MRPDGARRRSGAAKSQRPIAPQQTKETTDPRQRTGDGDPALLRPIPLAECRLADHLARSSCWPSSPLGPVPNPAPLGLNIPLKLTAQHTGIFSPFHTVTARPVTNAARRCSRAGAGDCGAIARARTPAGWPPRDA